MTSPLPLDERRIHFFFEGSLLIKGAFAVLESVGGLLAYFVPKHVLVDLVVGLTSVEMTEDSHDVIATYLLHAAQQFSPNTRYFTSVYLLSHGLIKLWLIVGLLRERLWYYPVAIFVFGLFIAYQVYRYTYTMSPFLLFITIIDGFVIALTWHEYGYIKRHSAPFSNAR